MGAGTSVPFDNGVNNERYCRISGADSRSRPQNYIIILYFKDELK